MTTYQVKVRQVPVNLEEETRATELFEGDGMPKVWGLGSRDPEVMEQYEVSYRGAKIEGKLAYNPRLIKYARREDGTYERMVIDFGGRVLDLVRDRDRITSAPGWLHMSAPIALLTLQRADKQNLETISSKLPPNASAFLRILMSTSPDSVRDR